MIIPAFFLTRFRSIYSNRYVKRPLFFVVFFLISTVNYIDRCSCSKSFDIFNSSIHDTLAASFCSPGDMRCDNAVLRLEQRVVSADRFGRYYVKSSTSNLSAVECIGEILFYDHLTTAVIDDDDTVFHLCDVFLVDNTCIEWEKRHLISAVWIPMFPQPRSPYVIPASSTSG